MKNIFSFSAIVFFLFSIHSCRPDAVIQEPPPAEVTFTMTDSMKISSFYAQTMDSALYVSVNNKQFARSAPQLKMQFMQSGSDAKITIIDTSYKNYNGTIDIYFLNRNTTNLTGIYSTSSSDVCIIHSQQVGVGSWAFTGAGCDTPVSGTIKINYDSKTNTISGYIEKLSFPFGTYLPLYLNGTPPPSTLDVKLISSGSTRNLDAAFRFVRRI